MSGEILLQPEELHTEEAVLVRDVFGIEDPSILHPDDLREYEMLVDITAQFSRVNPENGQCQTITRGRLASIPAITQRHIGLVQAARGQLTYEDIRTSWFENMPENDGSRHPDLLFDIAQFNFGSDEPMADIVRAMTMAAEQRRAMRQMIKSQITRIATQYRNQRDLSDPTEDEAIDAYLDSVDQQFS